ncbi:ferredoxin reductase family protein [Desulfoplanes formicivorans]|uniref:ferredoxin reductase family protein n=1 Tax=Desulfoplanes formicivorans TaxID=1592317 RepID=UPI000853DE61|nr:FAD-binding oxidoreductase [Desulfoplanes formicivorans]
MDLFAYRRPALLLLVMLIAGISLAGIHAVLGYFPWQARAFPSDFSWKMVSAARMLGILVVVLITTQIILAARIPVLCSLFGLHGLLRAHRILAGIIVALAMGHPLLIMASGSFTASIFTTTGLPKLVGAVAVIMLACGAGVAFFRKALAIPYHLWSTLHGPVMIIATVVIFLHIVTVGYGLGSWPARLFMLTIQGIILGTLVWSMILRPLLTHKQVWTIQSVSHPCPDVVDLHIASGTSDPWSYHAGQFAFLTFLDPHIPREAHPFTIASGPSSPGHMRFVIRQCGDFTARLSQLRPGTSVLVDGPFGVFSPFFHNRVTPRKPMVFIAGGIGITPFLAMLETLSQDPNPPSILLAWSVKTGRDLLVAQDLATFCKSIKGLQLHYFITRDASYQGCTCRMNTQRLRSLLEEWTDALVFVCGPPGMTRSTLRSLAALKFTPKQIITESFSL